MTAPRRRGRAGRRAGDSGTREAILDAARHEFGQRGYDAATIRGIAAAAEVNPALVHHFYGTKEQLFTAAMRIPVVPSEVIKALIAESPEPEHTGEVLVRTLLAAWEVADVREAFLGLVRSAATSEQGAAMLREFVTGTILAAVAQMAGGGPDEANRRYRASLVASQVVGLAFTRYLLRLEPIASASADDLVAAIGPVIQRYLTGDLS